MEPATPFFLIGIVRGAAPGLPALRVGRVAGLLSDRPGAFPLPARALRLPEPLAFGSLHEVRAWLVAREPGLAASVLAIEGGQEAGLPSREDPSIHAASRRGADAVPARAVQRLRTALEREARHLAGTGLPLRPAPPGEVPGLASTVLQDA